MGAYFERKKVKEQMWKVQIRQVLKFWWNLNKFDDNEGLAQN